MRMFVNTVEVSKVAACLSTGWEFLSGECASFALSPERCSPPEPAEFSFFIPLGPRAVRTSGGVGVLIQPADARVLAAHMFAEAPEMLPLTSLVDACAEACNVLAVCVTINITQHTNLDIGLPFRAGAQAYEEIRRTCEPSAIYHCNTPRGQLCVIAYEVFSQS